MGAALLVMLGGAVGAVLRVAVSLRLPTVGFPRATLLVNAVGSLLLGATSAAAGEAPDAVTPLVALGFCGALTTFSTFAFEVAALFESGARRLAAAYGACSVAVALIACAGGFFAVTLVTG